MREREKKSRFRAFLRAQRESMRVAYKRFRVMAHMDDTERFVPKGIRPDRFSRLVAAPRQALKTTAYTFIAAVRVALPVVLPLLAVLMTVLIGILFGRYTVALQVIVGDDALPVYVRSEAEFSGVRDRLVTECYAHNNNEYYVDFYPTLQMVFVERDKLNTQEEIFDAVYSEVSGDLGSAYAVYLDGELLGTLKREADVLSLRRALVSAYVDDADANNWAYVSDFTYIKGQYDRRYAKTYELLLLLFTKPVKSVSHIVKQGETAQNIARMYGLSVPVLRLLNPDVDTDDLYAGLCLEVGAPRYRLSVMETASVTYTQITPYPTVSTQTDELFEGQSEVAVSGVNGLDEITVRVIRVNGVETSRTEVSRVRVRNTVTQHIYVGTKTIAPSGEFLWPLEDYQFISSYYGMRTLRGVPGFHRGLDIAASRGTDIYAADDGVICERGWQENGLGNYIKVDHGNGVISIYGHCSKLVSAMKVGKEVKKGDLLAYVGSTGNSTGNHLHFALYFEETREYINPLPYLKEPR